VDSEARPWTFKRTPGGDSAAAAVLQDELGASCLLCLGQLDAMFPNGFWFFVPNRDCVLVQADDAAPEVREQTAAMVRQLRERADVPMSPAPFSHLLLREALAEAGAFAQRSRHPNLRPLAAIAIRSSVLPPATNEGVVYHPKPIKNAPK